VPTRRHWLGLAAAAAAGCSRPPALPVFQSVPPFRLTASTGLPFDSARLKGNVWLASFFFASCNGPCPRMNSLIYGLQERTYTYKGLQIVSITVDPERDTPEALASYANRYKADPERWHFLTGDRAAISALARDAFQIGELDTAQTHSTRVFLIDRASRVRGHFPTAEKEDIDALERGIASVYQEGS